MKICICRVRFIWNAKVRDIIHFSVAIIIKATLISTLRLFTLVSTINIKIICTFWKEFRSQSSVLYALLLYFVCGQFNRVFKIGSSSQE